MGKSETALAAAKARKLVVKIEEAMGFASLQCTSKELAKIALSEELSFAQMAITERVANAAFELGAAIEAAKRVL